MLTDPLLDEASPTHTVTLQNFSIASDAPAAHRYKKPIFAVLRPEHTYISIDQAIQYTGDNSTYSKRILYLIAMVWASYSFLVMGISLFMGSKVTIFCFEARSNGYRECEMQEYCQPGMHTMLKPDHTIVSEFRLICNKEYLIAWISSAIYFSNMVSSACFPYFIDRHGRRPTLIFALLAASVATAVAALLWDFRLWMMCIFAAGFAFGGIETTARVYLSEVSGQNFRVNSAAVLSIVWAGSQIALGFIQMLVEYWRYIFIAFLAAPTFAGGLAGYVLLDESPRYLVSRGALSAAKRALMRATVVNRRPPFAFNLIEELSARNRAYAAPAVRTSTTETGPSPPAFFDSVEFLKPHLWLFAIWGVYYFAYFGLQFSIGNFKDASINFTFNGVAELLGVLLSSHVLKRYRKVPLLKWQLSIASAGCLCFRLANIDSYLWSFLIFLIKLDITVFAQTLHVLSLEVFPTKFRAQGYAYCFLFGRVSASAMPFVLTLFRTRLNLHPVFAIGVILAGGVLVALQVQDVDEFVVDVQARKPVGIAGLADGSIASLRPG